MGAAEVGDGMLTIHGGTGLEAAAGRAGASLVRPAGSWLWRRIRPDTSRMSITGYADDLADAVERRERALLDQLRGGPGTVMDVEFRLKTRLRTPDGGEVGALSGIGPCFRQLAVPARLVVLGEAGTEPPRV